MPGSGGAPGGKLGVTHSRGFCPVCLRDVPGGTDHSTGRVILRAHLTKPGGVRCADGDRLEALTDTQLAIRHIQGNPVPGAPEPHPGHLDYVRQCVLGTMSPEAWLASRGGDTSQSAAGTPAAPEPPATGCPACGSDDYDTEPGDDGPPDYEHGLKTCDECGEQWV